MATITLFAYKAKFFLLAKILCLSLFKFKE